MKHSTRNRLAIALIASLAVGFAYGGFYILYVQQTGKPTTAMVTRCETKNKSIVCYGSWTDGNQKVTGEIENVSTDLLGKEINVVIDGSRAIRPGYRLAVTLLILAGVVVWMGCYWYKHEAVR
jgi:hypothetical protein